jgi:molecular chaperone Hsp33
MLGREMNAPDRLVRAIDRATNVRVVVAVTSGVVQEALRRHKLSPASAVAVGRALTSGLLLATLTKGNERVTLQLMGDGPIGSITVDANGNGDVRGYALHPEAGPLSGEGRPSVASVLGRRGMVNVLRDLGLKELYQGQIALLTGEIDEDVESYLGNSEQVPSALGCEVVLDGDRVIGAAGILVQAMPGGDTAVVREVQHQLRSGRLYELLTAGERSPTTLGERLYTAGPLEVVGEDRAVRFQCRCSAEKIAQMLQLLGTVDLDEMIAENKPADVFCNYCNTHYQIGRSDLERIRAEVASRPRQSN